MIRKSFILKLFDAASMQRWNDKIRPVDLRELDKQAHKMVVAYFLGKFEEDRPGFDWIRIIEGGLFELLQRLVLTDIKPQIFYKIKGNSRKYEELNRWVYGKLEPLISPLGDEFCGRFRDYFTANEVDINRRILSAAHFYATRWEFDIIERMNPDGFEIKDIKKDLAKKQEQFYDLKGIDNLAKFENSRNFIDLCGQLRFQIRWSHIHRVPETSVLGHMLVVAIVSYLFSLELKSSRKRAINNYFTGLFHDLPEVLTRDIISPVKSSIPGLDDLIKEYEAEQMKSVVFGLVPSEWHEEIKLFTESEFWSVITESGGLRKVTSEEINKKYNSDEYNPRDGEIVKAVDDLAAFVEAYLSIRNGINISELHEARGYIRDKYRQSVIAGIKFGEIYADFD